MLLPPILGEPNFPKSANLSHFFVCRQKPIGLTNKWSTDLHTAKTEFSAIYFSISMAAWDKSCLFEA